MAGKPTVVYVHGNGNKIAKARLKRHWDEALFGREMGEATRMAYYADLRYPQGPLPSLRGDPIDGLEGSALESTDAEPLAHDEFVASLAARLLEDDSTALRGLADRWTAAIDTVATEDSTPFEVLPLPRPLRIALFQRVVRIVFKDVHAYFFGGDADALRRRLQDELRDLDGPVVVIAHSLGSIIAYDLLHMLGSDIDIALLLTVGSPLGIKEVQDLVARPLQVPEGVERWVNLADPLDIVALDKRLKGEYPPAARIEDHKVGNETPNHHSVSGYINKPEALTAVSAATGLS